MLSLVIPFTTDGAGAFSATLGKPADPLLLYSVHIAGANLGSGATVLIQQANTLAGFTRTILNLASGANVNAVYPPRVAETNTSGVAAATTTMMVLDGDVAVTIASGGANKTGTIVLHLLG